jgi:hypothetical protein
MATAEQMLNEAHYAFANITFGESFANARHAARAKSLSRKIIRAHAILRRLGEEAYASGMSARHRHVMGSEHQKAYPATAVYRSADAGQQARQGDTLDWSGIIGLLLGLPKAILFAVIAVGFVLFSLFGWFVAVPLVGLILFTGPFRSLLQPAQRNQLNDLVANINSFIDKQRETGGYS